MGFFPRLYAGDPGMLADPTGRRWYDMIQAGGQQGVQVAVEVIIAFSQNQFPEALASLPGTPAYRSAWEETIDAAEKYNDPGRFTAFIGYEWTSNTAGNNLHRVVIYRDGGATARVMEPYTTLKPLGSDNPRDLWNWMQTYMDKTGGQMLAIAHNGNLSNGIPGSTGRMSPCGPCSRPGSPASQETRDRAGQTAGGRPRWLAGAGVPVRTARSNR